MKDDFSKYTNFSQKSITIEEILEDKISGIEITFSLMGNRVNKLGVSVDNLNDSLKQTLRYLSGYTRIVDLGQQILTSEQKERLINTGKL
jgi:hypothetical protein